MKIMVDYKRKGKKIPVKKVDETLAWCGNSYGGSHYWALTSYVDGEGTNSMWE